MKKHLIKGLLVLAIILVGMGTFSSCKDTNEDVWAEVKGDQKALKEQFDQKVADLNAQIETLRQAQEACKQACEIKLQQLNQAILDLQQVMQRDYATKDELNAAKNALQQQITQLATDYANLKQDHDALAATVTSLGNTVSILSGKIDTLDGKIVTIDGRVTTLEGLVQALDLIARDAQNKAQQALDDLVLVHQELNNKVNKDEYTTTINNINNTINNLTTTISNLSQTIDGLRPDIQKGVDAWNWIEANKGRIDALEGAITRIDGELAALGLKDAQLEAAINEVKNDLQGKIDTINTKIGELETKLSTLEGQVSTLETNYATLNAALTALTTRVEANEQGITNLTTLVNALTGRVDALEGNVTDLQTRVSALEAALAGLATKDEVNALATRVATLENGLTELTNRVAANEAAIADLQAAVNNLLGLADRLNKLVTGIIVQAATNPVIGYLNLPIDVRTNMLMCYHGYAETTFEFPSNSSVAEYNNEAVLTAQDIANLAMASNFSTLKVEAGDCLVDNVGLEEGRAYAGKVYVTINPSNVDFTGVELPIVNSQDGECGIKLTGLKKSDKLLSFGFSRAAENGFYEADAYIVPADITSTKFTFEDGIKSAFKNAFTDRKQSDFVALLKVLYSQFNDVLPAYGLKAAWSAPDGAGNIKDYAVFSEYNLAATTFKPLSYKFFAGQSIDRKLPIITPISDLKFNLDRFTFNIDAPKITINDIELEFSLSAINIEYDGTIQVKISTPKFDSTGKFIGYEDVVYNVTDESLDAFIQKIEDAFNGQKDAWEDSIRDAFKKAMQNLQSQINDEVKKAFDSVAGQINDQIKDMINDAIDDIKDKVKPLDNLIDAYNRAANRINGMLDNPNHYLQIMMVYKAADGEYRQMSNSKAMPSPFILNGGNAINLFLTSYTGEIVAPAYQKFVGVTNVWNEAGEDASTDATCKQLMIEANESALFNSPIPGKATRVPMKVSKAGYTYEVVYAGLDYLGYTSTRKFYLKVK